MIKPTLIVAFLTSYLLYGCASMEDREYEKRGAFIGEKKEVLIAAIGEPKYTIDSTFDDMYASKTLVYASADPSLNCVESYKIELRSNVVVDYACR